MRIWPRNDAAAMASISQSNPAMRVDTDSPTTLDILRDLTARLPPVPFERLSHPLGPNGKHITLTLQRGEARVAGLYQAPDMSVALVDADAGTVMAPHDHTQAEYLIVVHGHLVVHRDTRDTPLGIGDILHIPANTPHWVEWEQESRVLTVTIPQSPGFPNA